MGLRFRPHNRFRRQPGESRAAWKARTRTEFQRRQQVALEARELKIALQMLHPVVSHPDPQLALATYRELKPFLLA